MTTVGYGDVIAVSRAERAFSLAAMLIGGACYGYLIGLMASTVSSVDANTRHYDERMELISR